LKGFKSANYDKKEDDIDFKICLVGKPNVGKSSIINAITGKKISLVSEIPGTTRDSIDTDISFEDKRIKIVDTAGLRRKSKIDDSIEYYSYLRSIRSMHSSDVVVIVTDATNPIAHYEKTILGDVEKLKKGCLLVVNKWDLIEKESSTMAEYQAYLRAKIPFLQWLPIVFTSAHQNKRLDNILKEVINIQSERVKKLSTSLLNRILDDVKVSHPPSALNSKKKHPKMYYITQTDITPPTFTIFVNDRSIIHQSYTRYIEKKFRDVFGFYGTPIKIILKNRPRN
jgi:GTP-binding protein